MLAKKEDYPEVSCRMLKGSDVSLALRLIKETYVDKKKWEKRMEDLPPPSFHFGLFQNSRLTAVIRIIDGRRTNGQLPISTHADLFEGVVIEGENAIELSRHVGKADKDDLALLYRTVGMFVIEREYEKAYAFTRAGMATKLKKVYGINWIPLGPEQEFKKKVFIPIEIGI